MSTQTVLTGLVLLLGMNQVVMHSGSLLANPALWRLLVAVNAVVASGVFVLGIPGFDQYPLVRWMVGFLFVMHAGELLFLREAKLRQWGLWEEDDFDTRVAKLTEELSRDDDAPPDDSKGTPGDKPQP